MALNLKELERRLDNALEKETKETLVEWLMKKQTEEFSDFLGEATFEPLGQESVSSFCKGSVVIRVSESEAYITATSYEYARAA